MSEEQMIYAQEQENAQSTVGAQSENVENVAEYTQRMAEQLGEERASLKTKGDIGTVLQRMQEGVIISLHIEGARRFWKRLTPADLGLAVSGESAVVFGQEASEVLADYFQLGRLSLLPSNKQLAKLPEDEREKFVSQEELATIERSARYCLDRYAFKSHWGSFIPVTTYQEWKAENAKYETAFNSLKERLLANYDNIVAAVIEAYRPLAQDAWRMVQMNKSLRHNSQSDDISEAVIREVVSHLAAGQGRDVFVANYLECIRMAIRSKDSVEASFKYEVERSIIPLPSLVAKDLESTDRLYKERAIRDAEVQVELERLEADRRIHEARAMTVEREEQQRRYQALQAERERLQLQLQMERDIVESARRDKQELLTQFYRDVIGQINDQLQSVCQSVTDNIESHEGTLRGPVSRQLRHLVTQLESLNFMQDARIEDMIASIREALPSSKEAEEAAKGLAKIDTTRLQTVLRQVHDQAKAVVIDLGMSPTVRRPRREEALSADGGLLLTVEIRQKRVEDGLTTAGKQTKTTRKRKENPLR